MTLKIDIDDTEIFDGAQQGWKHSLLIDPEDREISTFSAIGGGLPASVFNGNIIALEIPDRACGDSLRDVIKRILAERIEVVCDAFIPSDFVGMRGEYTRDVDRDLYEIESLLAEYVELAIDGFGDWWDSGCCEADRRGYALRVARGEYDAVFYEMLFGAEGVGYRVKESEIKTYINGLVEDVADSIDWDEDWDDDERVLPACELAELAAPELADLKWIVPHGSRGQIVEVSHAIAGDFLYRKSYDRNDRSVRFERTRDADLQNDFLDLDLEELELKWESLGWNR